MENEKSKIDNKIKLKKIIILLIILLVLLVIGLVIYNIIEENRFKEEVYGFDYENSIFVDTEKQKIFPENSVQLIYTYSGEEKISNEIYERIYEFESYMRVLYREMYVNKNSEKDYFSKHSQLILSKTGITDLADFKNLVKQLKKIDLNKSLDRAIFEIERKEETERYTICPLKFIYNDNTEIEIKFFLSNKTDNEIKYMFL